MYKVCEQNNCDRIWKNPASTHTISNLQFHQKWILGSIHYHIPLCALLKVMSLVSVAAFLRLCVSLEWHFGVIIWSWLSCICAWRATKSWPMSVIFNLECYEHKKGPVGPQTGPLAFNCLRIPFCTPILSPPPTPPPPPLLLPRAISLLSRKKAAENSLNFGYLKFIHSHNYS